MPDLPDPGFAGDDGSAAPGVTAALTTYAAEPERGHRPALAALQHSRFLVPVVATLGEVEEVEEGERGLAHDKSSDMATVLMRGRDGRLALLAFTSTDSLHAWNPDARPVPVGIVQAARAALQDDAPAIVVDVAGPVMFVVEGGDLCALAGGKMLREVEGGYAWFAHPR